MSRSIPFAADAVVRSVDAGALGHYMTGMRGGFAETEVAGAAGPVHFSPAPGPKHFRPADPSHNPTAGWDPFDPAGSTERDPLADELDCARADGFAAGLNAAQQSAASDAAAQVAAIDRLTAALADINGFDRDALATRLRQTVLFLVTRTIGDTGISPDMLAARIEAAVKLLADNSEPALMRLNPQDLPMVDGRLPDRVFAIADSGIERGGLLIETKSMVVEDGPSGWLAQLAGAIDRTALPGAA